METFIRTQPVVGMINTYWFQAKASRIHNAEQCIISFQDTECRSEMLDKPFKLMQEKNWSEKESERDGKIL